jgi:protein TonB
MLERSKQAIALGFVAVVHLLLWWLLTRGMTVFPENSAYSAVSVTLLDAVKPPSQPVEPLLPPIQALPAEQMFIPIPEINVVRQASISVAATSIDSVHAAYRPAMTESESGSTELITLSESEVDYLVRPTVRYPSLAKRAKQQGTVILLVIINTSGWVDNIRIYQSSGHAQLDQAAVRAVRSLRVRPYLRNGVSMPIEIRVPVEFSLRAQV